MISHKYRKNNRVIGKYESVVFAAGVVLVFVLVYTIREYFSPIVALGSVIAVLYPLRQRPYVKTFIWTAVGLFSIWFIGELLPLLTPFIVALLLAYIFNPLVDRMEHSRIPRWAGSLIVILGIALLGAATLVLLVPVVITQFRALLLSLAPAVASLVQQLSSGELYTKLQALGIPVEALREQLMQEIGPRLEQILTGLVSGAFSLVTNVSAIATKLVNAVLIPFLGFYMLKDLHKIRDAVLWLIPNRFHLRITSYGERVDSILGLYLRGALTVASIIGVLATLLLWIFGINYPFVLGPLAGMLDLIPYFGILTSITISVLVALFSGGTVLWKVIFVLITFGLLQILETTVLQPRIVGAKIGIHPLLLILSLFVFGHFLGFGGFLIAVPITAILIAFAKNRESEAIRQRRTADLKN